VYKKSVAENYEESDSAHVSKRVAPSPAWKRPIQNHWHVHYKLAPLRRLQPTELLWDVQVHHEITRPTIAAPAEPRIPD